MAVMELKTRQTSRTFEFEEIVRAAHAAEKEISDLAAQHDQNAAVPDQEIDSLFRHGLLLAPFPAEFGGMSLGSRGDDTAPVMDILGILGGASLPVGRLFEGHLNAVSLVARYGSSDNLKLLHQEVSEGRLTGVWMAENEPGLRLDATGSGLLTGAKIFCSGAGFIRRPLVAAHLEGAAGPQMLIPYVSDDKRCSTQAWQVMGMKASATGDVNFSGLSVTQSELVGWPNDYYQSPYFRGGAWRVLAVQFGGLEKLFELYRLQLSAAPKPVSPVQIARFGDAATHLETARLWVRQAGFMADGGTEDAVAIDAYVDLARGAFEDAANTLMANLQRGLGLRALIAPNPIERIIRDLTTYLRQPALDFSLLSAAEYILNEGVRRFLPCK